jgi:dTDP-glucose 4,6-dehydratase
MRVLVAGCAGFIGWKVSEVLLKSGHLVVGVDDLNQSYDPRLKDWRLSQLLESPSFTFRRGDITDRAEIDEVFRQGHVDAVVNLAARAGVRQSVEEPYRYYKTNVMGTLNLLEACRELAVPKFVLASTSSVYGNSQGPYREDTASDRPLSPYAASKKAAEVTCHTYHHLHGLDVTVVRYFTVYGPAGRPDMSVFRFIRQIAEGEPITLYGDGSQERDFTYVDDIAHGTLAALSPVGFEVVNLGSNRPVVLREVIRFIEELLGQRAQVESLPQHAADVPSTWANIDKANRLFDWRPQVSFEQGVSRAVEWYRQNRHWAKTVA